MARETWVAAALVSAFAIGAPFAAVAQLPADQFVCTVSPAWGGRTAMPLRISVASGKMHVLLLSKPPTTGSWLILENNDLGIVAANGFAVVPPGSPAVIGGSMIFLERRTGFIRWTESGVDNLAIVDRTGNCSVDGLPG